MNSQRCDLRQSAEKLYDKLHISGRESHLFAYILKLLGSPSYLGGESGVHGSNMTTVLFKW